MGFLIFILFLWILVVILKKLFRRDYWKGYSYTKSEYVMTQAERDCFNALIKIVGENYWVFPQMHFSAFLNHRVVGQNWDGAFWHVNGKSVDFLLCTKDRLSPRLAIELDDVTHNRRDRQERDEEEERIFEDADMPLLRIKHEDIDNIEGLRLEIQAALAPKPVSVAEVQIPWYRRFFGFA